MNVPAFSVVAGTPAKIIKYRFSQNQIEQIEKSNWWEYEIDEAKNILSQLKNEIKI